jgi:hypothetical protein
MRRKRVRTQLATDPRSAPRTTVSKSVTHTTYDTVRPPTRPEAGNPVGKAVAHPPDACAAISGGAAAVY